MAISMRDRLLAKTQKSKDMNAVAFRKKPIWSFKPQDGEKPLVRPLTGGNHLIQITSHNVTVETANGRKRVVEYLCMTQFGQHCPMCEANKGYRELLCMILYQYDCIIETKGGFSPRQIEIEPTKFIDANPVKVFMRTPGRGYANHFALLELDKTYEKKGGLAGRDFEILRTGAGMETTYSFAGLDAEPFVKPKGLNEKHMETLNTVMKAIKENDMAVLIDLILPIFDLQEGITEYPKGSDYVTEYAEVGITEDTASDKDEVTEDGKKGAAADTSPPWDGDEPKAEVTEEAGAKTGKAKETNPKTAGKARARSKKTEDFEDTVD